MAKKRRLRLTATHTYTQDICIDRYGRHWLREITRGKGSKFYRVAIDIVDGKRTLDFIGLKVQPVGEFLTDDDVILEDGI